MSERLSSESNFDHVSQIIRRAWEIVEAIQTKHLLEEKGEEIPDDLHDYTEDDLAEVRRQLAQAIPQIVRGLSSTDPEPALKIIHDLSMTEEFVELSARLLSNAMPNLTKLFRTDSCERVLEIFMDVSLHSNMESDEPDLHMVPTSKMRMAIQAELEAIREYIQAHPEGDGSVTRQKRFKNLELLIHMLDDDHPEWLEEEIAAMLIRAMKDGHLVKNTFTLQSLRDGKNEDLLDSYHVQFAFENFGLEASVRIYERIFQEYGLPLSAYVDDVGLTCIADEMAPRVHPGHYLMEQLLALESLIQREGVDAAELLYEHYGIRWFSRYDVHTLARMVRDHDDISQPFGIAVVALHDNNGAFFDKHYRDLIHRLDDDLQEIDFTMRIFEVGSRTELKQRLDWLASLYEGNHKISFQLVSAHSGKSHIELGRGDDGDIVPADLRSGGVLYMPEYYTPGAVGVFDGCASGRRGGIGGQATTFPRTITSKGLQSALMEITPSVKEGEENELEFETMFDVGVGNVGQLMPGRVHRQGRAE